MLNLRLVALLIPCLPLACDKSEGPAASAASAAPSAVPTAAKPASASAAKPTGASAPAVKSTTFEVGPLVSGKFTPVGKLTLDPKGKGTLTIDVPGKHATKLEKAWAEISKLETLQVKRGREEPDGTHVLEGFEVKRGTQGYAHGVADVLSSDYGLFCVEQ